MFGTHFDFEFMNELSLLRNLNAINKIAVQMANFLKGLVICVTAAASVIGWA